MAFALFKPIKVLPRVRLSPGYALVDQSGDVITSEDGRGAITLYTFMPLNCGDQCDEVNRTMAEVRERVAADIDLAGTDFRMVTVALDDDPSSADLAVAADRAGAPDDGSWSFVGGEATAISNVVALGFERPAAIADFQPGYAIVDHGGIIRGEYRYRTLGDQTDRLVDHIDILGSELRNGGGIAGFAYGAAHVFQCYP